MTHGALQADRTSRPVARWIGMLRAVLAVSFTLPLLAAAATPRANVTGEYRSNWDDVRLVQDGARVYGSYVCCGGGSIEGRIEGRTIRYRWANPGATGLGVWHVDGNRLRGTWGTGQDDDNGGRWDLVRRAQLAQ